MGLFSKDKLKFWLGLLVSLLFLYLAFQGQDFGKIGQALSEANYWWLLPALGAYFLGVWIRAVRWHYLLGPLKKVPVKRLFPVVVIGYMANDVLPVRMGEVVRSYVLGRRENVSKTGTLATIVVERIMDGITMLLFLSSTALFVTINKDIEGIERLASIVFLIFIVIFFIVASSRSLLLKLEAFGLKLLPALIRPKVAGIADKFIDGLQVLRQWRDLMAVFSLSVLAWLCEAAMYWMVALAFTGLNLTWQAVIMTLAVANLFTLVPSTPGYVGPFDFAANKVLVSVFLVNRELASSYVILLHAALYFPVTLWGVYYWISEHFSFKEAEHERELVLEAQKHSKINPPLNFVAPSPETKQVVTNESKLTPLNFAAPTTETKPVGKQPTSK
ncbi:MAG: flippase-like domain-containing protein [Chloroflexi bacterium]|nr:flippase-like domain-containing protein [Chloroflexota bacterium]